MDWSKLFSIYRLNSGKAYQPNFRPDLRNEFDSDYGRIIFSPSLRRMHDKTQVFPLNSDDNIHTRLTHTLEVTSLARSIGLNIFSNVKIVKRLKIKKTEHAKFLRDVTVILENVSLCHDIGNPPFGHYGEECLSNYFKEYFTKNNVNLKEDEKADFTKFNGNVQGFRVLTSLQVLQDKYGLNLTIATLSAFLKYPNLTSDIRNAYGKDYKCRLGVFQSEKNKLNAIRGKTGLINIRNPLTFIMEAADSICYAIMDIEDALNKNCFSLDFVLEYMKKEKDREINGLINTFESNIKKTLNKKEPNYKESRIVQFRIFFLRRLAHIACEEFINNLDGIEDGSYTGELIFDSNCKLGKVLKKFTKEHIQQLREIHFLEIEGETIIKGILEHFVPAFLKNKEEDDMYSNRAKRLLCLISNSIKKSIYYETKRKTINVNSKKDKNKEINVYELSDYYKLRMIVDYISGMTDSHAMKIYQKLQGIN